MTICNVVGPRNRLLARLFGIAHLAWMRPGRVRGAGLLFVGRILAALHTVLSICGCYAAVGPTVGYRTGEGFTMGVEIDAAALVYLHGGGGAFMSQAVKEDGSHVTARYMCTLGPAISNPKLGRVLVPRLRGDSGSHPMTAKAVRVSWFVGWVDLFSLRGKTTFPPSWGGSLA